MPEEPTIPKQGPNFVLIFGLVILLAALGAGGYLGWQWWQNQQEATPPSDNSGTPSESDAGQSTTPPTTTSVDTTPITVPAALKENIEAAINTMNTAALEGYMTNPVTVVLAASEKGGPVTPTQAISDLNYLTGATTPWNWSLSAATLTAYKNGFYGQYFPDNSVVGQSANKYVVAFTVNSSGKISTVFMTGSADLLK